MSYISDLYTKYNMPSKLEIDNATLENIGWLEKEVMRNYEIAERAFNRVTTASTIFYKKDADMTMDLVKKKEEF